MKSSLFSRVVAMVGAGGLVFGLSAVAHATSCNTLKVSLQPDCFRPTLTSACNAPKSGDQLDLGPQIAVWIESGDGIRFIDTIMVTNQVARRGIGNRPGEWDFLSGPKFPYGKRKMALPIWAHRRGTLYDTVVMQDGMESWLGWHEPISSPDPYYCRPMMWSEIDVDAVTCPTATFNSSKGRLDSSTKSYYPPRNDLTMFTAKDCDILGGAAGCPTDSTSYETLNDLDAVAAATPAYGSTWTGLWTIPAALPAGDYAVLVEVNKEYDYNASHLHPSFVDPMLAGYGAPKNFGQPSMLYRVPVHIDRYAVDASTMSIDGYGDWAGDSALENPRDGTISTTPGSGEGRLLVIDSPTGFGTGRVHVSVQGCTGAVGAEPAPDGGSGGGGGSSDDGPIDDAGGTGGGGGGVADAPADGTLLRPDGPHAEAAQFDAGSLSSGRGCSCRTGGASGGTSLGAITLGALPVLALLACARSRRSRRR